jgi:tetratricopeptide (TPR) repeat protein
MAVTRYDEALEVLERAAAVHQASGALEHLGQAIALIGQVHRLRPTAEEGLARIRPVLDSLEQVGPSGGLASLYTTLAHLHFAVGEYQGQLAAATRAATLAREVGTERLLADIEESRGSAMIRIRLILVDALHAQAMVFTHTHASSAARAALTEGLALARALPYRHGEARLLEADGWLHACAEEAEIARTQLAAAAAIYRQLGARLDQVRTERVVVTLAVPPCL